MYQVFLTFTLKFWLIFLAKPWIYNLQEADIFTVFFYEVFKFKKNSSSLFYLYLIFYLAYF